MNGWETIDSIWYRGKLDSCNYTCSYCPFGRKNNQHSVQEDQRLFQQFCDTMAKQTRPLCLMLIPYGEALIHSYYREGLIHLAGLSHVSGIGCQTNLSFSVSSFLQTMEQQQVTPSKIKLWATFHPEMTTIETFTRKVIQLKQAGIELSTGIVGNPEQLPLITRLRKTLPPDIYLFINAMEGLKRKLTADEKNNSKP
ncbi:MAG: STM4011 family radical SAM protein [Tannerellaceae bacterium]|nr:STM4011 family radical SAM protein [Tannerellaceae bacterium]